MTHFQCQYRTPNSDEKRKQTVWIDFPPQKHARIEISDLTLQTSSIALRQSGKQGFEFQFLIGKRDTFGKRKNQQSRRLNL